MVQAKTWSELISTLEQMASGEGAWFAPMVSFAKDVSKLADSWNLFPYLSMHTLGIAQTGEIQDFQERFLIKFDSEKQLFRFAYTDSSAWLSHSPPGLRGKHSWYRECSTDSSISSFKKFLSQVSWISE